MSALSGLANSAGRIPVSAAALTDYFRGMGRVGLSLKTVASPGTAPLNFNGTVFVDATGATITDAVGAITVRNGGIPLTAAGALAIEVAAPTVYDQGVGFTAAGRVAVV